MVVRDVIVRQGPAFAVFKPFRADLITSDMEIPDRLRNSFKPGGLRFVQPDGIFRPCRFLNYGILVTDKTSERVAELRRFQQM